MAKKRTPEQEALSRAKKMPERKRFMSRKMAWAKGDRPVNWSFFTNWRGFCLSIGELEGASEKETAPQPKFLVSLDWRPFGFVIWWRSRRLVWVGDWEWKKALRNG